MHMAVTASFSAGNLSVFGDALTNTVTISRNAAGTILVNGGAVKVTGGTATVANTKLIQAFGLSGDDIITIDESNGPMPAANLFGGAGNDRLTGGSGNDMRSVRPATTRCSARAATIFCSAAPTMTR
jgi:Ca2+-binding RTX toxin-like protein